MNAQVRKTHKSSTGARRLVALLALASLLAVAVAARVGLAAGLKDVGWRIKIHEAAIVSGERVRLAEIASPVGRVDQAAWNEIGARELWQAPPQPLKPMLINKPKLKEALAQYLGEDAELCILPSALAIQQGGAVVLQDELVRHVVNSLTPRVAALGGEAEFKDAQAPQYVFLSDPANTLDVEIGPNGLKPGRVSFRIREIGLDGRVIHRVAASVQLDLWKTVPAAARPLNSNEELKVQDITFVRKNLAYLREEAWDGKGGPWRIKRPVGANEPIYTANIEGMPLIKRGDKVSLIFKGKHVHLHVQAEAMADGGYDASIPVRNLQTKVQVFARIVDAKTVQVF